MPNRSADAVFQLIKSLEKAEKRNFKLFASRNSDSGTLKTILLFDLMDRMEEYDEAVLLRKSKTLKKEQLPNLKAQLYRQILASLRILRDDSNVEILLHEQLEYAMILYDKGLYRQSLRLLERIKELSIHNQQNTFLLQVLVFEKKIEGLHITRSNEHRADQLAQEVTQLTRRLTLIGQLSNLSLQLYSWYIVTGHARNEKDLNAVRTFFKSQLPEEQPEANNFFGRLYLYQAHCWQAFIAQDFLQYYRSAQRWVDLFEEEPHIKRLEVAYYVKGMHNLLTAHFMLRNHRRFEATLHQLEAFAASELATLTESTGEQTFMYLYMARLNGYFLKGDFRGGLSLVPEIEAGTTKYRYQTDQHRVLVFAYKVACMYFGSGDFERTIEYLHRIIHVRTALRSDLQCYARLLHLIAHYELGNHSILEHLIKSVYRFMSKMENLSLVEEEIFKFLRRSFSLNNPARVRQAFIQLRAKLQSIEKNRFETRSFMYLDIIGWLDSKISGVPVQQVLQQKYVEEMEGRL